MVLMTACLLMFSSWATLSSWFSIGPAKSTLTRWTGSIIRPALVKNREMSFPRSAKRAMASAETGFGFLRLLFIEFPFFIGRLPERNQVVVFALGIVPDLENQGVKSAAYPADRAVLLRKIGALIEVIGMREDFLRVFESDATLRVCPKPLTLSLRQTEIACDWYNSYTITTNASCVNKRHGLMRHGLSD